MIKRFLFILFTIFLQLNTIGQIGYLGKKFSLDISANIPINVIHNDLKLNYIIGEKIEIFGVFGKSFNSKYYIQKQKNYIYIDVGGGSTEITYIKGDQKIASRSFNIGSVRQLKGNEKDEVNKEAVSWIKEQVLKHGKVEEAIGTGGNINKIYNYSTHKMQEPLDIEQLRSMIDIIEKHSYEDRIRILKLKPNRADIIIYGSNIYLKMMEAAGAHKIIVPKVGLTDGIIYQLFLNQEAKKN